VKNYKPLRNVVDLIRNVGSSYKANEDIYDEYSLIKTTFNTIVTHENQLEQKVNRYKPMAMYSILLKLFHGLVNYKDLEDIVDILSCDVTGYLWSAAVFHVHPIVEYKEIDVTIIKNENNLPLIAYIARIKDNRFAVLIGYRDNVKKDAFEIVKTTLSTKYSDNQIKIGIGMEYQDILLVHKSYIESLLAVENCMIKSRMHIMYYENINNASEINYFYPLEIENKIISNTIMGNYSIVETSINDLIAKNLENTVSVISARCQCYSLISTAFKVLTTAGVGTTNYIDENILISMDTLDDMTEYIKSVYKRICIEMVKVKESSNFDTRDKIIEYIERNYSDPTIYLSSVAEKFGFSESYLSRFIKDQTGIGFTSYLTQIRLAKAKELMKDEKYTMDCISLKVGYSNVLTFRRAFKKYEGITPGKYQRMINYV
jgi:AraC-like DNA-binding protein